MNKTSHHLIIVWNTALGKFNEIVTDLNSKFTIQNIYDITWPGISFKQNLAKFYINNLSKFDDGHITQIINDKASHCGTGNFAAIIVEDSNPDMQVTDTSSGPDTVNMNIFKCKQLYRDWTGGGHRIHTSNNIRECNADLTLLLGKNLEDFIKGNQPWNGKITELLNKQMPGTGGWTSIEELFYVLNNTMEYVVLRNFEPIPEQYHVDNHGDIDLLVEDYKKAVHIIGGVNTNTHQNCVHHKVNINNSIVPFDFRFVGDNYYDKKWQQNILSNKVFHKNLFYIPDYTNYFYSLLYHATVQKVESPMPTDYEQRLLKMAKEYNINFDSNISKSNENLKKFLNTFMVEHKYSYIQPIDPSVSSPKLSFYAEKV